MGKRLRRLRYKRKKKIITKERLKKVGGFAAAFGRGLYVLGKKGKEYYDKRKAKKVEEDYSI